MSIPISTIKALNTNYSRPNRYWVQIAVPPVLQGDGDAYRVKDIELNCSVAQMPSVSVATSELRTKGPIRQMPYDQIYNDLNLRFYVDDQYKERRFFEKWCNSISDNDTKSFEYYDNYTSYIVIAQLNMAGRVIHAVRLEEAYPKRVEEIPLSYEASNTIESFGVAFVYRRWQQIDANDPLNIFKKLISSNLETVVPDGIKKFFT